MNKKRGWRFGIKENRILCMLLILLLPVSAAAEPTTAEQARRVVQYWLHQNQQPLETKMSTAVLDVKTFSDDTGQALYHVVSLQPDGLCDYCR